MEQKEYLLDGEPVTAHELINAAKVHQDNGSGLYTTSNAAAILRAVGYTVETANKGEKETQG